MSSVEKLDRIFENEADFHASMASIREEWDASEKSEKDAVSTLMNVLKAQIARHDANKALRQEA